MIRYRPDAVIQTSVDRRMLANAYLYFREVGYEAKSRSDIMRKVLEEMNKLILSTGRIEGIESTDAATELLNEVGLSNLNPRGELGASFMEHLQRQDSELEGRESKAEFIFRNRKAKAKELSPREMGMLKRVANRVDKMSETEREARRLQAEKEELEDQERLKGLGK